MKTKTALIAAALAASTMLGAGTARAAHITGGCAQELNAVESAINAADFLSRRAEMDRTNLLTKLDAAAAKIEQDKVSDAIDKLMDISDKATYLATAPKPKLDDATGINNAVGEAIGCVGAL